MNIVLTVRIVMMRMNMLWLMLWKGKKQGAREHGGDADEYVPVMERANKV